MALRRALPDGSTRAHVRAALTAVMRGPRRAGDVRRGRLAADRLLAGHQPGIGESYISTGSLYLCAGVFLPLGLPPDDPFWTRPPLPWTARRAWSGETFPIDGALKE